MFSNSTTTKPTPPAPEKVERKPQREASNAPSIISSDVRISGDLVSPGEVQFDGHMEGDITCGNLTVGESAEIDGTLTANRVIVHGTINGSIRARTVHLHSSSKLTGDVVHEDLTIESGAYIDGRCLHVNNPLENKEPAGRQDAVKPAAAASQAAPAGEAASGQADKAPAGDDKAPAAGDNKAKTQNEAEYKAVQSKPATKMSA